MTYGELIRNGYRKVEFDKELNLIAAYNEDGNLIQSFNSAAKVTYILAPEKSKGKIYLLVLQVQEDGSTKMLHKVFLSVLESILHVPTCIRDGAKQRLIKNVQGGNYDSLFPLMADTIKLQEE